GKLHHPTPCGVDELVEGVFSTLRLVGGASNAATKATRFRSISGDCKLHHGHAVFGWHPHAPLCAPCLACGGIGLCCCHFPALPSGTLNVVFKPLGRPVRQWLSVGAKLDCFWPWWLVWRGVGQ